MELARSQGPIPSAGGSGHSGAKHPRTRLLCAITGLATFAIAAVLAAGFNVGSLGAVLAIAATAVYAGRLIVGCLAAACADAALAAAAERARLLRFCSEPAPVWMRQIETARRQGDAEVAELSHAFGDIVHRLESSMCAETAGRGRAQAGDALEVLQRNTRDLSSLVDALKSLQQRNESVVADVAAESALLQESASEIRQIALRTRVVAMNATIEAARAGAAGRAFAVIVNDMRELAARTAEFSDQCTRRAQGLHGLVSSALAQCGADDRQQDTTSIAWAHALVEQVIRRFEATAAAMEENVGQMEAERREVRGDIARALVALQFQDRVSQILAHVSDGIGQSRDDLSSGQWAAMAEGEWRARLTSTYSTPEEFRNVEGHHEARRPDSGVTFF